MGSILGGPRALYGFHLEMASRGISSVLIYMGSRREILVELQGSDTKLKSDTFDLF